VTVDQDAPNTVIPLFDVFADAEDPDAVLRIQLAGNTNAGRFSSVSVDAATGLLTIDFAPGASGEGMLIVRATDTAGAYSDTAFDVTVRPAPAPQPDPDPVPTPDPDPVPDPSPPTPAPVAQGTKSLAGRLLQKSGRRRVGVAGVQVFLDADDGGVFDAGEAAATTGADGSFVLSGLAAGKYRVRLADNSGWRVASRRNPSGVASKPVVIRARQQRVAKVKPLLLTPAGA
jgi:hypothetical protein